MQNKIDVSVCCLAYNHELYIEKTLESIINQKVNFNYEIIIHEDASTDKTLSILKKYKKKYPNLIKIIEEKENQYSKDTQSVLEITFKKAKGKYIAFCECDDYWYDKNKLQKQYNYMEKHPDCTLCTHGYQLLENNDIIENRFLYNKNKDIKIPEYINRKHAIQSATMFFKKKDIFPLPDYFYNAKIGDIPIQLHLIEKGYCHYINKIMSTYRFQSIGSYSSAHKGNIIKKKNNHIMTCNIYKEFDKHTNGKYHELIEDYLLKYSFEFYLSIDDLKELKAKKYKELYKTIAFKKKIKMYLKNNKYIYKVYTFIKKGDK